MIHSLSGGVIKKKELYDFAKVKIAGADVILWYKTDIPLCEGDIVVVPLGKNNELKKAVVLRVDTDVSSDASPVSPRMAKNVYMVLKN